MWGSNVPVTRTPDAHFMTEARYRGQKVITVSPDYADNTKFADEWLAPHPGTDGALAMAMGHVILKEFLVERRTPRFIDYLKRFSDAPYLITLDERGDAWVPGKFLTAADLGGFTARVANAEFKTVMLNDRSQPVVPNGSLGHRFSADDEGSWNLDLGDIDPLLSIADGDQWRGASVAVDLPRFDVAPEPGREHEGGAGAIRRGVPVTTVEGRTVTTVFDLLLAQYGVARESLGLPGQWATGYDDATSSLVRIPDQPEPRVGVTGKRRDTDVCARQRLPKRSQTVTLAVGACQRIPERADLVPERLQVAALREVRDANEREPRQRSGDEEPRDDSAPAGLDVGTPRGFVGRGVCPLRWLCCRRLRDGRPSLACTRQHAPAKGSGRGAVRNARRDRRGRLSVFVHELPQLLVHRETLLERGLLGAVERVECVSTCEVGPAIAHRRAPSGAFSSALSLLMPSLSRVFTVPSGSPSVDAISDCVSPLKYASSSARR
jgi:hypothetical protein